jgi:hypothetical protein
LDGRPRFPKPRPLHGTAEEEIDAQGREEAAKSRENFTHDSPSVKDPLER